MKILQGTVQFCIATNPFLAIAPRYPKTTKTKRPDRENQWFQRSIHLQKTQTHRKRVTWTYGLLDSGYPLRWRSPIPKSETQFFTPIFTTHNLLKILRREIRGFSDRYFTKKSASPAGMFRGCEKDERHSCDEARPPPKRARA